MTMRGIVTADSHKVILMLSINERKKRVKTWFLKKLKVLFQFTNMFIVIFVTLSFPYMLGTGRINGHQWDGMAGLFPEKSLFIQIDQNYGDDILIPKMNHKNIITYAFHWRHRGRRGAQQKGPSPTRMNSTTTKNIKFHSRLKPHSNSFTSIGFLLCVRNSVVDRVVLAFMLGIQ